MTNSTKQQIRHWSIISGISLLIMAVAAGYAYGYVFNQIYVAGNAIATFNNIQANNMVYVTGILAWGVVLVTDLLVTYGFYVYLKSLNRKQALVSGLLRLVYSLVLAIGILSLIRNDMALFNGIWSFGLIIFGFHLTVTGMAITKETGLLRILGILLMIAGIGYSMVHGLYSFLPNLDYFTASLESVLVLPMTAGELLFGIWLLIKGGKNTSQQFSDGYAQVVE